MKNLMKFATILVLFSLPSLMKSQCVSPYPLKNNLICDIDILVTVYNKNCTVVFGPTMVNIPSGNTYNTTTPPLQTWEVEIKVIDVASPSCPVTQLNGPVKASCGSTCPPKPMASPITGGCCPVNNINATCAGATIN